MDTAHSWGGTHRHTHRTNSETRTLHARTHTPDKHARRTHAHTHTPDKHARRTHAHTHTAYCSRKQCTLHFSCAMNDALSSKQSWVEGLSKATGFTVRTCLPQNHNQWQTHSALIIRWTRVNQYRAGLYYTHWVTDSLSHYHFLAWHLCLPLCLQFTYNGWL